MTSKEYFEVPGRYKTWSYGLIGVGILALIVGYFMYGTGDEHHKTRFWAALLQNSVYFLMVVNASIFTFL